MPTLTVYDFCNLCTEDSEVITICDLAHGEAKDVFCGPLWEAMRSDYADWEVISYDFWGRTLALNINTAE